MTAGGAGGEVEGCREKGRGRVFITGEALAGDGKTELSTALFYPISRNCPNSCPKLS